MKKTEEEIIEHLPRTSFMAQKKYDNKPDSQYTNGWGLIIFPLLAFIGVLYLIFKVWL